MLGREATVATLPRQKDRLAALRELSALRKKPRLGPGTEAIFRWLQQHPEEKPQRWVAMETHRNAAMYEDFLTPLLQRAVYDDFPALFSPYPNMRDRGKPWRMHGGRTSATPRTRFPLPGAGRKRPSS
jgi:hypothetical protein